MSMTIPLLLIVSWGALAFGAVYGWAYAVLLVLCCGTAVWGLVRDVPPVRKRVNVPILVGVLLVAGAIGLQLVPLNRATIVQRSAATDDFLRQYDVGYALSAVLETRAAASPGQVGGLGAVRHPLSINPQKTQLGLLFLAGFGALLLGLARGLDGFELRRFVPGLAILGVLLALVGIIQRAMWNGKVYGFWEPENKGVLAFGPFINPNHFAGWMLMAVPLVLGYVAAQVTRGMEDVNPGWRHRLLWFSTPQARRTVLTGLSVLVMAFALALTLSRSGIACLLIAVLLSGFNLLRYQGLTRLQRVLSGLALVAVIVAIGWAGVDDMASRFSFADQGLSVRMGVWGDAWRIHQLFPAYGTGFNTYGTATAVLQQFQAGSVHYAEAHNDYLQILVEGGYLVAVPVLLLVAIVAWQIRLRFLEDNDDSTGYWIRLGAVTGMVAVMFQELVEFSLQMPGNAALFTILCAIAVRKSSPRCRPDL
jgi:hypothetical protein